MVTLPQNLSAVCSLLLNYWTYGFCPFLPVCAAVSEGILPRNEKLSSNLLLTTFEKAYLVHSAFSVQLK
jgi:hypothetical protein